MKENDEKNNDEFIYETISPYDLAELIEKDKKIGSKGFQN
jgi:hypothetical protein